MCPPEHTKRAPTTQPVLSPESSTSGDLDGRDVLPARRNRLLIRQLTLKPEPRTVLGVSWVVWEPRNSKQALQSLRQWRKKQTAEETEVPGPTMAPGPERPWRGNRWRLSKKNLPSCVATWHAWMKSMDAEEFFDTVTKRPELLPAYTEAAQAEGMAGEGNEVCLETADFLERLHSEEGSRPWKIVDLGCGDAALAKEMRQRRPDLEMTCVDAARLARGVVVQNLAALPDDWAAAFDVAVLCRALWSLDYEKVLSEAHRVLKQSPDSRVLVVEPIKRWLDRSKDGGPEQPNELIQALQRAGFYMLRAENVRFEEGGEEENGTKRVFQFLWASAVPP
ncbi:unnamed protein product [Symbiodinium sp. CCMP2592]|nr:unnamed protein product [Symbiodinium sp. CCMP2592]